MHLFIHLWTFVPYQKANLTIESVIKEYINQKRDYETKIRKLVFWSRYLLCMFQVKFSLRNDGHRI